VPELLGLTGVRGAVVPVFSLAALLNSALRESEPRWLLFAGRQSLVAFAFGQLEHQFEAEAAQVFPQAGHYGRYVSETVRDGTRLRCLIRLGALAEHIRNRGSKNSL
jgi:chemotaxis signal transduction protein